MLKINLIFKKFANFTENNLRILRIKNAKFKKNVGEQIFLWTQPYREIKSAYVYLQEIRANSLTLFPLKSSENYTGARLFTFLHCFTEASLNYSVKPKPRLYFFQME